jgi:small multidrug resistance pump
VTWAYLAGAILIEVAATLSLRVAANGRRTWYVGVVVGYVISFALLSLALDAGMGIGVAYGIWTAVGVAFTAVLSKVLFDEPLTPVMGLGIALIVGGVVLLELGAPH